MGPLKLTPPVDESIAALGSAHRPLARSCSWNTGPGLDGNSLVIPTQQPMTQEPELFKLSDLRNGGTPIGLWSALDSEARVAESADRLRTSISGEALIWRVTYFQYGPEMRSGGHCCVAPSN